MDTVKTFVEVSSVLATLTGISSLISVCVNICKFYRVIPEGSAGRVFSVANLIAFITLSAFRIFSPEYTLQYLDGIAGQIAVVGLFISGYLFQLGSGQTVYQIIKQADIPILSHSDSRVSQG